MPSFDFDTSLSKLAFLIKQLTLDSSSFLTSFIWPSEATSSDNIKTFNVCEGQQLFVFHHSVQRNSTDLRSSTCDGFFFLQNLQCLEGWNSAFEEDMPMGASDRTHASENERSQTCIQVTMLPLANCAISLREKYENVSG